MSPRSPGSFFFSDVQKREMAGLDDVSDLARQVLPDPGQFGQVGPNRQQVPHALREAFNGTGRPAVGAHAKLIVPLELEEIGSLVEHRRDFSVLDRHNLPEKISLRGTPTPIGIHGL